MGGIHELFGGGLGPRGGTVGYDTGVSVLAICLRFALWVLIILAVIWVVRELLRTASRWHAAPHATPPNPALAELEMLYARGEVSRTDFLARRADLTGLPPPMPPLG
jgi:hypothetical protein